MTQTQEIFTTGDLAELCVTFRHALEKIQGTCRITREDWVKDIDTLEWLASCYTMPKLLSSIDVHHDFMRSTEWKYGSGCFDHGAWLTTKTRFVLCIELVEVVARNSKEKTKQDLMCVKKNLSDLFDHKLFL